MKKQWLLSILVVIGLILTGCESTKGVFKKERTINYLMDGYIKAYTKADLEATKDIFAPFYLEYNKKYLTQESLDKELKAAKETYGDNFSITYKVDKEIKFTKEELKKFNNKLKDLYKTEAKTEKCYKYEGKITLKGSKKTDALTLVTIGRCNFDGTWYLVRR